ncbi:hypothetical protein [Pseudoxanthomonas broegbernensis]|uniref:hypothetical protein n=1 Tax=Pseudoxanthomonas broegbernensis TaxID=83619 RepID=UPI001391ED85|nr:hypothetical protein [Pseudoxanthomonas broegbernensis]MBB6065304.1 hypothetical protein [Pseudoxanthomonas broegbernensis]
MLKRQDRNKTTPGNVFGDQHGIESGSLSFNVVDVDIPGNNNLSVEFRRTLAATDPLKQVNNYAYAYPGTRLGDWAMALPKIEGTFDAKVGWITSDPSRPTRNCSITQPSYMEPPPGQEYPSTFRAHMFWNPPTLHYPDGSSALLVHNSSGMPVPTSSGPYLWTTTRQDAASCIGALKNQNDSLPIDSQERIFGRGEGYLVTRADGTKYWFDWMALESILPSMSSAQNPSGGVMEVTLQQATLALYPTRIEDRFGNWVTYTYSNKSNESVKLDKIESSDERIINVGYVNGYLTTVTANGRTWSYVYQSNPSGVPFIPLSAMRLVEVSNPDSSRWLYSGVSHPPAPPPVIRPCDDLSWTQGVNTDATTVGDTDFTGYTVDAPSGARAVFRVQAVLLGRSAVEDGCYSPGASPAGSTPLQVPRRFLGGYRPALTGKKVTGPGMPPALWKYGYQSDIGFAPMANGTTRTRILGPDGALDTYTFGNTYSDDEGLLLSHTRVANAQPHQVLMGETHTYAIGTNAPGFPKPVGYFPDAFDRVPATHLRPKLSTTKVMQSRTFKWEVANSCSGTGSAPCLDDLGRPTMVTESSSPAP